MFCNLVLLTIFAWLPPAGGPPQTLEVEKILSYADCTAAQAALDGLRVYTSTSGGASAVTYGRRVSQEGPG